VSAFGQSGPVVASDTTDANGDYSIAGLPVGDHFATVTVDGAQADSATVSIMDSTTTTQNFNLTEASFSVSILSTSNTTAGQTQSFDVEITNSGDLAGTGTVSLDWGPGVNSTSVTETLAGGDSATRTLQVDIGSGQPVGFYDVNVSSDDDFDTAQVAVGPQRSLNTTSPAPGQTIEVTVTGEIGSQNDIDLIEAWSPSADGSRIVSTSFGTDLEFATGTDVIVGMPDAGPGTLTVVYEIDVPSSASDGDVYEWDPLMGGDGSLLRVGGEEIPILGDQQFQVTT
jgi:hypothetical protein